MRPIGLLLALAATSSAAAGQVLHPSAPGPLVWQAEVGGGVEASPLWAGGGVHLSAGRRFAVRVGIDARVELTLGAAEPTSIQAVSVAAGVRGGHGRIHVAAYAGPALVWGLGRSDAGAGRERYATVGAELSGSAVVDVGAGIGLGVDVSGNVNPEVSAVGARLTAHVRLGRAR